MRERKYIDPGAPFGSAGCQVLKLEEDTAKVVRPFQPISLGGQALRPLGVSAAARSVQPELDQLSDRLRARSSLMRNHPFIDALRELSRKPDRHDRILPGSGSAPLFSYYGN
jgi:hypothetical protein